MVYASTSLALAAIETFVNLEPNLIPVDLVSIEGEIPESLVVPKLDPSVLPGDWHVSRGESLQKFGDDWVRSLETVALLVPSAAIPAEWNVLLNPADANFAQVQFKSPERFEFDARMFR